MLPVECVARGYLAGSGLVEYQATGSVCGVKVQELEPGLMQEIRFLDKLVDELAKGRPMAKVLRTV